MRWLFNETWRALTTDDGSKRGGLLAVTLVVVLSTAVGTGVSWLGTGAFAWRAVAVSFLVPLIVATPFMLGRVRLGRRFVAARRELERQVERLRRAEAAREAGERRFRALLEGSLQGVCVHRDFRPLYCNAAFAAMFGYVDRDRILALPSLVELFAPDARAALHDDHARLQVGSSVTQQADRAALRVDGTRIWVEARETVVDWDGGPAVQMIAVDVTQRHTIADLKNEFISIVSHELRTPLTSIKGAVDLLASGMAGSMSEPANKLLGIASANSRRLERLINDILDVERVEAGALPFDLRPLSALETLRSATHENEGYAESLGVSIEVVEPKGDSTVHGDPDRLHQVLTNLLSNAVKFSPRGGKVEVTAQSTPSGMVRFIVSDRGPGIPDEFRDRVFEKFTRGETPSDRKISGAGLGLNIAKTLVERLGGRIAFESRTGGGTRFMVDLPAWSDPAAPSPTRH